MAIAYKSQGAGASTETSGAALSPLCPATVDAGDILIAHVFWEATTTAPAEPSGWTTLYGPSVIQSTIARHWVFGKIAAGTEDGAAVAFGSPAVTTQRAARVYSFSGRVSGTITELVNGFTETSHATDPQMPTVTTTRTGAMAVALVAQNDNNAFTSPTGETGGDWVEAVAEYTAALTPGFSLGIETCIPTADPGTVTGGAMATTNDPCGVIGFQILDAPVAPVTVIPDTLALVDDEFAPTIVVTNNQLVIPSTLAIVDTQVAPTLVVTDHQLVVPATLALSDAHFAPTVVLGTVVVPTTLALSTGASTEAPQDFTMDFDPNDAGNTIVGGEYSVLKDLSANSYDLEQGTAALRPAQLDVSGRNVAQFTFDGINVQRLVQEAGADWLDVVSDAAFTLAARVRMTSAPTQDEAVAANGVHGIIATSFGIFVLGVRENGGIYEFVAGMYNNAYTSFLVGSGSKSLNTWYDVVARFYDTTLSITVDGAETTTTVSGTLPYFAWEAAPVNIGRNPSGNSPFMGDVDYARIYDYKLSDGEISLLSAEWNGGGAALSPTVLTPRVVVPDTLAISDTQFAPTVIATAHQVVVPTTLALVSAQLTPTTLTPRVVVPAAATLSLSGQVPDVLASAALVLVPPTAALSLNEQVPTVLTPRLLVPSTAALSLNEQAPTVLTPKVVVPALGVLSTSGSAPTIQTPRTVTPSIGAFTTTGRTPSVVLGITTKPAAQALTLTGQAPTALTPRVVVPAAAALSLNEQAPTVLTPKVVVPATSSTALSGQAPTIQTPRTMVPGTAALSLNEQTPTILLPKTVVPATATLTATGSAPALLLPRAVVPPAQALTLTGFNPIIQLGDEVVLEPLVRTLTLTGQAPTVRVSQSAVPAAASLTLTGRVPTILAPRMMTPAEAELELQGLSPAILVSVRVFPAATTLELGVQPPNVVASSHQVVSPGVRALALSAFAPFISNPRTVVPAASVLSFMWLTPIVTAGGDEAAAPPTVARTSAGRRWWNREGRRPPAKTTPAQTARPTPRPTPPAPEPRTVRSQKPPRPGRAAPKPTRRR